ncbi:unnamed protein product [Kuraishia capsulata CBS 1993]|uniref:Amino acid permease/ SLC12A domain-containing protein n=1 Tax=Kuraishia capsulata CBS 1993 TaxID=1382522 RepID=W6MM89_9ASCO|nr:uncharacterized protein KUCA_T00003663001 [Kuraishia capsulata CBS 1993]CDK27684.1 unnamed protein product [Kuraishia capsulata CBS 1993]
MVNYSLLQNGEDVVAGLSHIPGRVVEFLGDDDVGEEVEHFNYKQELSRKLTVSSMIGLGFSLMGVPFGVSTTLSIGLIDGGSATILWGWVTVTLLSLCVALSLAEVSSKYPSSGGTYHFAAILANEKYSLVASWFTGWFLIMGNWTMFISIVYGGSQFILSVLGLKDDEYKSDSILTLMLYICLVIFCAFVNLKLSKYLEKINTLCIYWTIYTVLIMDVLLMLFSSSFHDVKYILTNFDASRSGWPDPIAFLIGLQSASFTLQGYNMIPAMSDEVKNPERNVPKGMIFSVLVAGVTGVIFIIPILSILPELTLLLDSNPDIFPIDLVFKLSTQSLLVSFVLVLLLIGTVLFAGIGTLTTASRLTYAFARDGALPYKDLWTHVDDMGEQSIVPRNALFLSTVVSILLSLLSLVSSSAFSAFVGSAVISLSLASGIPILCLLLNKRRKIRGAHFKLHKFGWVFNAISLIWVSLSIIILCMPPQIPITVRSMNYAFVVSILFGVSATIAYFLWGKGHFHGPMLDEHILAESQQNSVLMQPIVNPVETNDIDPFGDQSTFFVDNPEDIWEEDEQYERELTPASNDTLNADLGASSNLIKTFKLEEEPRAVHEEDGSSSEAPNHRELL